MKIKLRTGALILAVFAILSGCATTAQETMTTTSYKIMAYVEDGTTAPIFKTEGSIQDKGAISGDQLPQQNVTETTIWKGNRVLKGEKGEIVISVDAQVSPSSKGVTAQGKFSIVSGTNEYAGLQGTGGVFQAHTDSKGRVREWFLGGSDSNS